jgi:fructokinase
MSGKTYDIVAFGEVLWDLLPDETVLGGAPFNFINRINERGHNGHMISRVGTDDFGDSAEEQMKKLGIQTTYIQKDADHPTGTVEVYLDENKNPDYNIITEVAYDFVDYNESLVNLVKKADCICFGSLVQRNNVSRDTLNRLLNYFNGKYVFYDINLRKNCYNASILEESLKHSNILKLNNDELKQLPEILGLETESAVGLVEKLIRTFDLHYCLVTFGEGGVLALSSKGETVYRPSYKVDLVDPCGSGDAFSAGFLDALLRGEDINSASDFGNVIGGIVASQKGATQPISDQDILEFKKHCVPNIVIEKFKDFLIT